MCLVKILPIKISYSNTKLIYVLFLRITPYTVQHADVHVRTRAHSSLQTYIQTRKPYSYELFRKLDWQNLNIDGVTICVSLRRERRLPSNPGYAVLLRLL